MTPAESNTVTVRPLCFVAAPFGVKADAAGRLIDFDTVYRELIAPAIEAAGLEPLRGDEEATGGIIHKVMFERLLICPFAVVDLTTGNPNVFYEMGVRHAARPYATVLMFASDARLPFDAAPLRALPYALSGDGRLAAVQKDVEALAGLLQAARDSRTDSPLFQLLDGLRPQDIPHDTTDVFRDRVAYSKSVKEALAAARRAGREAVHKVAEGLGVIADCEAGIVIDLYLSYRAVKAWDAMAALEAVMAPHLRDTPLVQEQLGLALNRLGRGDDARRVLEALIARRGPSSETLGILGRVYKDRWEAAQKRGDPVAAEGLLDEAISTYLKGFEADFRDYYPGVNAVTLMELREPPDPRREALVPVVRYAVERRIARGRPDYWDHATVLELAVLGGDEPGARAAHRCAVAAIREKWEPETTARNLRLIGEVRRRRGTAKDWMRELEEDLQRRGV
jgi:tetratricopeptide (TPR) repeat protein